MMLLGHFCFFPTSEPPVICDALTDIVWNISQDGSGTEAVQPYVFLLNSQRPICLQKKLLCQRKGHNRNFIKLVRLKQFVVRNFFESTSRHRSVLLIVKGQQG